MYCNNCGKLIPDDANFCNHCGAKAASAQYRQGTSAPQRTSAPRTSTPPRTTAAPQQTTASRPSQSNETPKVTAQNSILAANAEKEKKGGLGGIFLVVLVFIVCYCLGNGVVAEFLSPGSSSDSGSSSSSGTIAIIPDTSAISVTGFHTPEGLSFDDILPDEAEYLVNEQHFYSPNHAAYVTFYEGTSYMLLEYGYDGDVVQELENTLIIPVNGIDYATIGNMLIETQGVIDELHTKHACMTGTASVLGDYEYIYIQVRITNLDHPSNIAAALEEEILIAPEGTTPVSMYDSEQMLKEQGFARK